MRIIAPVFLVFGLVLHAHCMAMEKNTPKEDDTGILECVFTNNARNCLRTRLARDLDQIELEVTGKKSEPPMSAVIEQAGNVIAQVVDDLQENNAEEIVKEDDAQNDNIEEARKKKFKKKHLKKILGLVMLLKAKLSLLLQLISTHFQFKFFIIAIISLILNAARFWIEIKKPSKVIYYEHAQHQHHYDHDEHGYWGRSSNETPHELAYRSYAPTN
ncbi:PREDICTED: uncharacterized protein LOC108777299 [Cyphomyrmex costatus]|uniref:Uncharacterized protein n=1 Tax=Cyphomyrmex costatus TaxID=456900 RepID=A0A195CEL7_9HYME|nr:PREDICTED: uncharacterized protein LOC108777299 [Cyphomyrmex costatus]KYM98666.1 hypothetical protein ALC62_10634 [Cyphomyrmex costatus]